MTVDDLKDRLNGANNGYDPVYVSDGFLRYSLDNIHIDDGYVELKYKNHDLDAYEFLYTFELIAIEYELHLCMKRAPLGSGLCFFFIDPDTKQISESHWFYMNHTTPQALLENLEMLAKEFKERCKKND